MAKKVKSYRLDSENAIWLSSQGAAMSGGRSASWYLNDLITRCRAKIESKQVASPAPKRKAFVKPCFTEVHQYMVEKAVSFSVANVESEKFCDFYEMKGWMVGKNKMKDWKAAVRNWIKGRSNETIRQNGNATSPKPSEIDKLNQQMLDKYGHTAAPTERTINPNADTGLGSNQVQRGVYAEVDGNGVTIDMGSSFIDADR